MNDEEKKEEEEEKNEALNKEKYEQGIKDYLSKEYACHITDVTVGETSVTIQEIIRAKVLSSWAKYLLLWTCLKRRR